MDPYLLLHYTMAGIGLAGLAVLGLAGHLHIGGGHGLDAGHDLDVGHDVDVGHDLDVGHGVDVDHGLEAGHAPGDLDHDLGGAFHAWSPIVVSTVLFMSGASGIAATNLGLGGGWSLPPAFGAGLLVSAAALFGLNTMMRKLQGTCSYRNTDIVHRDAEVITPIPEGGVGEVAFIIQHTRRCGPARSADGAAVPRGARVTIVDLRDNGYLVRPTTEERLRLLRSVETSATPEDGVREPVAAPEPAEMERPQTETE